ncbi:MAG: hypothetical protein PHS97_00165 [Oscillospiraceae bacterium]|nr:hypothetical protein [Oscillospiraceae bacterium]
MNAPPFIMTVLRFLTHSQNSKKVGRCCVPLFYSKSLPAVSAKQRILRIMREDAAPREIAHSADCKAEQRANADVCVKQLVFHCGTTAGQWEQNEKHEGIIFLIAAGTRFSVRNGLLACFLNPFLLHRNAPFRQLMDGVRWVTNR